MEEEKISQSPILLFTYSSFAPIYTISGIKYEVQAYFTDCLHFSQLTPQTSIFGFHNINNDTFLIQNHKIHLDR